MITDTASESAAGAGLSNSAIGRDKVLLWWAAGSVVLSIAFTLIAVLFWELTYTPDATVDWSPKSGMRGMFTTMPFGWLVSVITPAGWLNLGGLIWALKTRDLKPLSLSATGAILFGLFWPRFFYTMMSA